MPDAGLRGALTALVTPFSEDGERIDFEGYERLLEAQLAAQIDGLVPCGTTGETPTLTGDEQQQLIRRTAAVAGSTLPIVAGVGSNNTRQTVENAKRALAAGATVVMVVMPYYNKPAQQGLIRHVETVAKSVDAPVVLYNIPGRTGVTLSVESTLRILDSCANVVAVKDATPGLDYATDLMVRAGERITLLSGEDAATLPMLALGGKGVISVTSNLYPAGVGEVARSALAGDWMKARRAHERLLPVHRVLFSEPSPGPVKAALATRGILRDVLRLPMTSVSESCRASIAHVTSAYEAASP